MFDDYLSQQREPDRAALADLVALVHRLAPEATEGRSYGLPAFRYRDRPLLGFAAHARHLGVYPFSPPVLASVAGELGGLEHAKGSIRFTPDHPLPDEVVAALVRGRMTEIDAT